MEDLGTSTSSSNSATVETAATPPPAAAPTPLSTATMETYSDRGSGNSFMDIVKNLNPMEVFFSILGATSLYTMIYYYNYKVHVGKTKTSDLENKIDELEIKLSDLSGTVKIQQEEIDKQQQQRQTNSWI